MQNYIKNYVKIFVTIYSFFFLPLQRGKKNHLGLGTPAYGLSD